jgi:hypothetical protein
MKRTKRGNRLTEVMVTSFDDGQLASYAVTARVFKISATAAMAASISASVL